MNRCTSDGSRKSTRRLFAILAAIVLCAMLLVWGETWALAHVLPAELTHVFSDGHGNSVVPVAIIH
jgi:hypothetical protein